MTEWRKILQAGEAEIPLAELELARPDGAKYEGTGRLIWNRDEGVTLEAMVKAEGLFLESMQYNELPGTILPRDKFYDLLACTQHGEQVKAHGIVGSQTIFGMSSYAVWRERLREVIFSSSMEGDTNWIYAILRPISHVNFNKSSKTIDDNAYFGFTRFGKDWLEFENAVGKVAARKRGENMMDVLLIADHDFDAMMASLESIRLGFSFLEGKNLEILGCEAMCNNTMYHGLFSSKPSSKSAFPVPLQQLPVPNEMLLRLSSQFFDSGVGRRFSDYLRMCWNVSDNMGTVGAIIASTTVEAMVKMLVSPPTGDAAPHGTYHAQQQKLVRYLEMRKEKYGENFVNRVSNMVAKGDPINVKKILRSWARRNLMNLTRSEVDAWDDVRNSSAHGKLLFLDPEAPKIQKNYDRRKRVENIVNKLAFQAMQYSGTYFDYSTWTPQQFTPCDESDLLTH